MGHKARDQHCVFCCTGNWCLLASHLESWSPRGRTMGPRCSAAPTTCHTTHESKSFFTCHPFSWKYALVVPGQEDLGWKVVLVDGDIIKLVTRMNRARPFPLQLVYLQQRLVPVTSQRRQRPTAVSCECFFARGRCVTVNMSSAL